MLPHFAAPAKTLDAIDVGCLTHDEQLTFSALVGHVNRRQPRIALLNRRSEEGRDTWFRTSTVDLQISEPFDDRNKYELIAKYAGEVSGVVMYDRRRGTVTYATWRSPLQDCERRCPSLAKCTNYLKSAASHCLFLRI